MAWTYTEAPATSKRDAIRFQLGDVKQTPASLSDAELDYLLAQAGNDANAAAIEAAYAMAARFSGMSATSKKVGDLTLSYAHGETANRYEALAARLLRRGAGKSRIFLPTSGDSGAAAFSIGMDDYAD